jgi:Gram-negative bacterial TonB protein C-terminal
MLHRTSHSRSALSPSAARVAGAVFVCALALSLAAWARQNPPAQQPQSTVSAGAQPEVQPAAQQPSGQQSPEQQAPQSVPTAESAPAKTDAAPAQPAATAAGAPSSAQPGEITEDEVRKLFVGKQLFLRGGYLDNSLTFNEHGALIGHSPEGSYTLSVIEIDKVHLSRHKVELEGQRYGLHFLGALPYEDPTKAVDRVNITPKKKEVRITVDRELVVKPKQDKEKGKLWWAKNTPAQKPATTAASPAGTPPASAQAETPASQTAAQPAVASGAATAAPTGESPDAEAQAEIAAAPAAERPADPSSVTTTTSPAHANKVLLDALDNVFAQGFDARMMDAMPGFWKLYYQAVAAKADYRPADPTVLRQNMVDQKARLVSNFEPASNQFAQDSGVAGMSLYHVVVGADGKPGEISVARPIGFGLDESAVDSIRKATFSPAIKDGKPVPVLLDLVVQFRIYSKRTAVASTPGPADQKGGSVLPGPYSAEHP